MNSNNKTFYITIGCLFITIILSMLAPPYAIALSQTKENQSISRMLISISAQTKNAQASLGKERLNPRVIAVMRSVPRSKFVVSHQKKEAYRNQNSDIGFGQTLALPFVTAVMLDQLNIKKGESVLELGTGSGYTAALLSLLSKSPVYSIDINSKMTRAAQQRLSKLGYSLVTIKNGNGLLGWQKQAPFDAIFIGFAVKKVPLALLKQLKPNGRIIASIINTKQKQNLFLFTKSSSVHITKKLIPIAMTFSIDKSI